jgi:hypothetical protein
VFFSSHIESTVANNILDEINSAMMSRFPIDGQIAFKFYFVRRPWYLKTALIRDEVELCLVSNGGH